MPTWCDADQSDTVARIDAALVKAAHYIVAKQSADGAWRSETYGALRDGPALTPYVMSCLFFLPQGGDEALGAFRQGVDYLVGMVGEDGTILTGPHGLNYSVYTAASASRVVVLEDRSPTHMRARAAWLDYARSRQLTAALGWGREDPEYGGWGFSMDPPRKPPPGGPKKMFCQSNLSATVFGIGALRSARVPHSDPAFQAALAFVRKCQNFAEDPAQADARFDDGGFFFIPGDPLQNKAGIAGTDRFERERYHSYGSMTADGVRALLQCGLEPTHPRVMAGRRWLERNFAAHTHPGRFAPDREVLREATYYYYMWAVTHAFARLRVTEIETADGHVRWAEAIVDELVSRQRPDGSWSNPFTDAKEDDPLVSTPWAAAALANCRHAITTGSWLLAQTRPITLASGRLRDSRGPQNTRGPAPDFSQP